MILMPVSLLHSGMIIAKDVDINSSKGSFAPLVRKGVCLNEILIGNLESRSIDAVYVEMEGTEDIAIVDVIDSKLKNEALTHIEELFNIYDIANRNITSKMLNDTKKLSKKLIKNAFNNPTILISLTNLKKHDDYTYIHSLCVALLSIAIGISMQYDYSELENLATAALLHDIGKASIPNDVLNKPGKLTEDEFRLIKTHPVTGEHIVLKSDAMTSYSILTGIKSHHERYDGTGYPDGLKKDEIHPFAKIIAIGDVYDALTSDRSYRKAAKPCEAIEYIMGCGNSHFDMEIIEHFLKKVVAYPVGSIVQLSDGREAVVVKNYPDSIMRPLLRIIDKQVVQKRELDLRQDINCYNITIAGIL